MSADELAAEIEEIREEYRRRSVAPQVAGQYSFLNPAHAFLVLEREREILGALGRHLGKDLADVDVLDVGSGVGTSLAFLAAYGADPGRLHGVDTDEARIATGSARWPRFDIRHSDGMTLPYPDDSFDLVQQITMLSSVHSDALREQIATEMRRVVRPGGLILSFDVLAPGLAPRLLNRVLSLGRRRAPGQGVGEGGPAVQLRPVRPLDVAELQRLFAPASPVEARRLNPYRPLVERLGSRWLPRSFGTALLWVARA